MQEKENLIEEGIALYHSGNVQLNKTNKNQYFQASITEDGKVYHTSIYVYTNGKIASRSCDCLRAKRGELCSHVFALFRAYEDDFKKAEDKSQSISEQDSRRYRPFKKDKKQYYYYQMEQITKDFRLTKGLMNQAEQLLKKNPYPFTGCNSGFDTNSKKQALRIVQQYDEVKVQFGANATSCLYMRCSCGEMDYPPANLWGECAEISKSGEPCCVHGAALFLSLDRYIQKVNPGDETDRDAQIFLNAFQNSFLKESVASNTEDDTESKNGRSFTIVPSIRRESEKIWYITFKIGIDRLYVLKNITEVAEAYRKKESYVFGKNLTLDFSKDVPDETAKAFLKFILDESEIMQAGAEVQRQRYTWYPGRNDDEKLQSKIPMIAGAIDRCFPCIEGKTIEISDVRSRSTRTYTAVEQMIKPIIHIEKNVDENGAFLGIIVEGKLPTLIASGSRLYCVDMENRLFCRIPEKNTEMLSMLSEATDQEGTFYFTIGRRGMVNFYHNVLPRLQEFSEIHEEDTDEIGQYVSSDPAFEFFLDSSDGLPCCYATVAYDDNVYEIDPEFLPQPISMEVGRDSMAETRVVNCMQQWFPTVGEWNNRKVSFCKNDEDSIYHFLNNGIDALNALGKVSATDGFTGIRVRKHIPISIGVSIENDLLNLSVESTDLTQQELLDLMQSYRLKKRYHRLKNGDFINLTDEVGELTDMMDAMHLSDKEFLKGHIHVPVFRSLYMDKLLEKNEELYTYRDKNFRSLVRSFKTVSDSEYEVPASLDATMRGYQKFGHKWIRTLANNGFGGILADEMGLGKTLQMISVLLAEKEENPECGTSIIITPASLVFNWAEELEKFAPSLRVTTISGTAAERKELIAQYTQYDVLVTSYDLLKRDIALYEDIHFLYQVLDEAQFIKNHTTAAARSVKGINAKNKFALTGTPIENRLSEMWSIFDYLMPGFLYGYETFRSTFEVPIVKHSDTDSSDRLRRMVAPFILRRLKEDVLKDLPEKMEEVRYAQFETEQQHIYDAQVLKTRRDLLDKSEEGFNMDKLKLLSELTRIRQICCDPSLFLEDYTGSSCKLEACMDLISSAMEGEHRMLIFSQFTSMLEILEKKLQKENIPYYKITGATAKKERLQLVKKFNGDTTPVFLISLKAGGTGLNLTGADVVIHYDPWWNAAAQNQATDRAHRIGQTKPVTVYKLIVKGSIEEKILKMQEDKKDLAESMLSGETKGLGAMTREELLELLG